MEAIYIFLAVAIVMLPIVFLWAAYGPESFNKYFLNRPPPDEIQVEADTSGANIECTYLGGNGVPFLGVGNTYQVVINNPKGTVEIIGNDTQRLDVQYSQLTELKVDGPGQVTTNAGVIGGGFGLESALLGIGAAALANTLTTTTTTNTVLYFAWQGAELFFHTSKYPPDKARMVLSKAFTVIQSAKTQSAKLFNSPDFTSQLERLTKLKDSGALTDKEFSSGKAKLLSDAGDPSQKSDTT